MGWRVLWCVAGGGVLGSVFCLLPSTASFCGGCYLKPMRSPWQMLSSCCVLLLYLSALSTNGKIDLFTPTSLLLSSVVTTFLAISSGQIPVSHSLAIFPSPPNLNTTGGSSDSASHDTSQLTVVEFALHFIEATYSLHVNMVFGMRSGKYIVGMLSKAGVQLRPPNHM